MNRKFCLLTCLVLLSMCVPFAQASEPRTRQVPVLHSAHPSDAIDTNDARDMASAVVYADTFEKLVGARAWSAAGAIAPLRETFASSPRLSQRSFTSAWQAWDIYRLSQEWVVDEDGRGLWRVETLPTGSTSGRGLTLGIRQQPDGRWWMILLRTRDDPGLAPWSCSPTCQIVVSVGQRRFPLTARPPLGYDYRASDVVGALLPASLLSNRADWIWTVQSPDYQEDTSEFDLSWLPMLCRQKLKSCP